MAVGTVESQYDLFGSLAPKPTWVPKKWICVPRTEHKLDWWSLSEPIVQRTAGGSVPPDYVTVFNERFYSDMLTGAGARGMFLKMHQVLASTGTHFDAFIGDPTPGAVTNEFYAAFQMVAATMPSTSEARLETEEHIVRVLRKLPVMSTITDKGMLHAALVIWMCAVELIAGAADGARGVADQLTVRFTKELASLASDQIACSRLNCRCVERAWALLLRRGSAQFWTNTHLALSSDVDTREGGMFNGYASIAAPIGSSFANILVFYSEYVAEECDFAGWNELLKAVIAFVPQLDDRRLLEVCSTMCDLMRRRAESQQSTDGADSLVFKLWEHIAPKLAERKELSSDTILPSSVSGYEAKISEYSTLAWISLEHDSLWTAFVKLSAVCSTDRHAWESIRRRIFEQWTSLKAKRWNCTETERVVLLHLAHGFSIDLAYAVDRVVSLFGPVLEDNSASDSRCKEVILNSMIFLLGLAWARGSHHPMLEQCVRAGILKQVTDGQVFASRAFVGIFVWVFKVLVPRTTSSGVELSRRLEAAIPKLRDEQFCEILEQLAGAPALPINLWKRAATLWSTQRSGCYFGALKFIANQIWLSLPATSRSQIKPKLEALAEEFLVGFKTSKSVQPVVELIHHCVQDKPKSEVLTPLWVIVLFSATEDSLNADVADAVHSGLLSTFQDMDPFIEGCSSEKTHDRLFAWMLQCLADMEGGMEPMVEQQAREFCKEWISRRIADLAQIQLSRQDLALTAKATILRRCSLVVLKIGRTLFALSADALNASAISGMLQCISDIKNYPQYHTDDLDDDTVEMIACNSTEGLLSVDVRKSQKAQDLKFYLARRVSIMVDLLQKRRLVEKLQPLLQRHRDSELMRDPKLVHLKDLLKSD